MEDGMSRSRAKHRTSRSKWSARVTRESHALTLGEGVFKQRSSREIARSLKRSADRSRARKANSYRSALSMLTFYINRAGRNLPAGRKHVLQTSKDELRKLYGRTAS
jgi:hypothetical protein